MRPSAVAVDFGSEPDSPPRSSSDFEEISYPQNRWPASRKEEELPLHFMTEETARRRVPKGAGGPPAYEFSEKQQLMDEYDDEGKDVYKKARGPANHIGSGRPRQAPLPPPTSIVSNEDLSSIRT